EPTPDSEPTIVEPQVLKNPILSSTEKREVLPNTGQANNSFISIIGLVLLIATSMVTKLFKGYKKQQ
ncbi:TPA: LPXTG cell wall anchor domain-containing protein, partial [Streptococcus suis]